MRELARRHPDEFVQIHDAERAAEGMVPIDPTKFHGDRYDDARIEGRKHREATSHKLAYLTAAQASCAECDWFAPKRGEDE